MDCGRLVQPVLAWRWYVIWRSIIVRSIHLLSFASLLLVFPACDGSEDPMDEMSDEGETGDGDSADVGDEGDTGDGGPVDTDGDGLSDEEEAEIGSDPTLKDTDGDNYWDSWEVWEGTDPLDKASRIYQGYWPYVPNKDELEQGSWAGANHQVGTLFPRDSFLDQYGDMVDIYDFAHFTLNADAEESYFIFDLSAQWCGPCHNVANWIAGVDNVDTEWIQALYPTVREKVDTYRIWWVTFIVQNSAGGAPGANDAVTWMQTHKDSQIPILVDAEQEVQNAYMGPAFPHFMLFNPDMSMEYYPPENNSDPNDPYPAVGLVDTLL